MTDRQMIRQRCSRTIFFFSSELNVYFSGMHDGEALENRRQSNGTEFTG